MAFLKDKKNSSLHLVLVFLMFLAGSSFFLSPRIGSAYADQQKTYQDSDGGSDLLAETSEKLQDRVHKFMEEPGQNPFLRIVLIFMTFLFFLVLVAGLVFDGYFFWRFRKGEVPEIRTVPYKLPAWGLLDILLFMIVFYIAGMGSVFFASFLQSLFPLAGNDNFQMFIVSLGMNFLGIAFIIFLVKFIYSQDLEVLGLTKRRFIRNIGYGIIGYIALIPVLVAIGYATRYITQLIDYEAPTQEVVKVFMAEKEKPVLLLGVFAASIVAPFAEEIIFRGFAYSALKKKIGVFGSIFLTSLVFAVLHAHIVGIAPIFALGVLLAYLYEKTGSLVAPIAVHLTHNVVMVFVVFLMRGI